MPEPQQPQANRSVLGPIYTEDQDEERWSDEEDWSDTPSERDEHQNEASSHKVEAPSDLSRLRNPHSHRSRWDPGDTRENTTSDGTGHFGHQGSHASGQIVPYRLYHGRYVSPPNTRNPSSRKPPTAYPANPFSPPLTPYPANPRAKLDDSIFERRSTSMRDLPRRPLGKDKRKSLQSKSWVE
jgi:hypothetical protein